MEFTADQSVKSELLGAFSLLLVQIYQDNLDSNSEFIYFLNGLECVGSKDRSLPMMKIDIDL